MLRVYQILMDGFQWLGIWESLWMTVQIETSRSGLSRPSLLVDYSYIHTFFHPPSTPSPTCVLHRSITSLHQFSQNYYLIIIISSCSAFAQPLQFNTRAQAG